MNNKKNDNYEQLHERYPDIVSLDQFREICHISKRKGSWILQHGIVPCQDSGKQTHRFKIKLDDIIKFLQDRDAGLNQDKIPIGIFTRAASQRILPSFPPVDPKPFSDFLEQKWESAPDALSTEQAATVASCHHKTVIKWIAEKQLTAINYKNKLIVPKESLIQFLVAQSLLPTYSPITYTLIEEYTNTYLTPEPEMTIQL